MSNPSLCAALHAPSTCPDCGGRGWYVMPTCCGNYVNGGCCENPEPEQVPCERCNMTGLIGPAV